MNVCFDHNTAALMLSVQLLMAEPNDGWQTENFFLLLFAIIRISMFHKYRDSRSAWLYEDIYGQKNDKCVFMIGTWLWNTSWKRKKHSSMCTCNIRTQNRSNVRFALYNMTWHFHHVKCNNLVTGAVEWDENDEIASLFKRRLPYCIGNHLLK